MIMTKGTHPAESVGLFARAEFVKQTKMCTKKRKEDELFARRGRYIGSSVTPHPSIHPFHELQVCKLRALMNVRSPQHEYDERIEPYKKPKIHNR